MTNPGRERAGDPRAPAQGRRPPEPSWPPTDYPGWATPTRQTDRTWTKAVADLPTIPASDLPGPPPAHTPATDTPHQAPAAGGTYHTPAAGARKVRAVARHSARRAWRRAWHWPALMVVGIAATWVLSAVALGDEPHPAGATAAPASACAAAPLRLRALYVRGDQQPDRHGQVLPAYRTVIAQMDALFERAGMRSNGQPVRFERDAACATVVQPVVVPQAAMTDASSVTAALRKLGFGGTDRFLFWYEADGCGTAPGNQGAAAPGARRVTQPTVGFAGLGRECWNLQASTREMLRALAR